jgi:hypothetical protein
LGVHGCSREKAYASFCLKKTPERGRVYFFYMEHCYYDTVELPITRAKWSVGIAPVVPQSSIKKQTKKVSGVRANLFYIRTATE